MRQHLLVSLLIGVIAGSMAVWFAPPVLSPSDFGWSLLAARDLLAGRDPFHRTPWMFMVPYPLPAALLALPLAPLPDMVAVFVFVGASIALLVWAVLRQGQPWLLYVLLSAPLLMAVKSLQWSPLLYASLLLPWLAPVALVKPTLGLAVLGARPSYGRIAGYAGVGLLSLAIMPTWPWTWLNQVQSYGGFVPILTWPVGPLLLLAGLQLRQPRGRLLLLLACMPQHVFLYDQLLVLAVARSQRELLLLIIGSWIAFFWAWAWHGAFVSPFTPPIIVSCIYLPALTVVLRPLLEPLRARPAKQTNPA